MKTQREYIDKPGRAAQIFGIVCFLVGVLASFVNAGSSEPLIPWGFGRGLLAGVFFVTLGSICNGVERTAHHTERLRKDLKTQD